MHHEPITIYTAAIAIALFLSTLIFGGWLALYAADAVWKRLERADDATRVRL